MNAKERKQLAILSKKDYVILWVSDKSYWYDYGWTPNKKEARRYTKSGAIKINKIRGFYNTEIVDINTIK